jgi:hypothetical protein
MSGIALKFIAATFSASLAAATLVTPSCQSAAIPLPGGTPELPQRFVSTDSIHSSGKTITVPSGGDLQTALDQAEPGDVISLQAGSTYMGPFTLPDKNGSAWITIQSSALTSLPGPNSRVGPTDSANMPQLEATTGSVIQTANRAHNYRFLGIEILPGEQSDSSVKQLTQWLRSTLSTSSAPETPKPRQAAVLTNLVTLGNGDTATSTLPSYIVFDRCYIHGDPTVGARRGIAMNSSYTAVVNSYLSDFKQTDVDAQAIESWNGPGPFRLQNDYLEASGENVMFGGEDPTIQGLVPSDIQVIGNHFAKPLAWMPGNPAYQGTAWSIKNIFELKNASRVLVEANVFEYNWAGSQDGYSILFTVRDQDGTAPWSMVRDVTFTDNVVQHVADGINVLGFDDNAPSQQTERILISNNLFQDVGGSWGDGNLLAMNDGASGVSMVHNTSLQTGSIIFADGRPNPGFSFSANIVPNNQYGIIGTNTGTGDQTLAQYFPGGMVQGNVIIGGSSSAYPRGNYFPASSTSVGFNDLAEGVYSLLAGSTYDSLAPGKQSIGVNAAALCTVLRQYEPNLTATIPSCQMGSL